MACKGKKWPPKWSLGVNDDDRCRLSTGCFDTNKCKRVFALDVGKKLPTDLPLPKGHVKIVKFRSGFALKRLSRIK